MSLKTFTPKLPSLSNEGGLSLYLSQIKKFPFSEGITANNAGLLMPGRVPRLKKAELSKQPVFPELKTASTVLSFSNLIALFIDESGFVFIIFEGLSLKY